MNRFTLAVAALALAVAAQQAAASPVTSIGGMTGPLTTVDFSQFTGGNQHQGVTGPVQVGGLVGLDITASSATSDLWLYDQGWSLSGNGFWDSGRDGFVGVFSGSGPVRFTFNDGPVSGIGFLANYAPGFSEPVVLSVFDAGGNLLESFAISATAPISTPSGVNVGAFRGIQRGQADIAYFEFTGFAGVFDDLVISQAAVPEPASLVVFGLAAGAAGLYGWRRRKQAVTV